MTETPAPADVACSRAGCGHDYVDHERGGACQAPGRCCTVCTQIGRPAAAGCQCPGFLWVDPVSDRPTYARPPAR